MDVATSGGCVDWISVDANLAIDSRQGPNVLNPTALRSQTSTVSAASILVVEDNGTTRSRLSNLLRGAGYDVTEAMDGLDALKRMSSRPFDAILLDFVLPNVDGWQFRATQLRHPEMASIPTVIVTVQPLRAAERYELRTIDVVQKSFEDAHLLQVLERACQIRQPARVARDADAIGLFWSRCAR
jgi:two-component system, chemotaxis family, chemotaxis protein CheY